MARPKKEGLDYFPLDVDIDQDDKIALIEAKYGAEGFAIVIKLLMKIYKNSYFYKWTEIEQLLFSKRVNVDINKVNVCIKDCIKWEMFSRDVYEKFEILTSVGVQRRYLEAVGRRQKAEMFKEYLLLEPNEVNAYKNLTLKSINVDINSINDDINPQSKVKESKENKTYFNLAIEDDSFLKIYCDQFLKKFNKEHMQIPEEKVNDLVKQIQYLKDRSSLGEFEEIVEYHFDNLPSGNNGDIRAFVHAFPRYLEELKPDEF